MTDTYDVTNPEKPTIEKDPNAVLDYTFNWEAWLDGDTIASATIVVDGTLTQPTPRVIGVGTVTAWLAGGTVGAKHKATCHIITANNPPREDDRTIYLKIKER